MTIFNLNFNYKSVGIVIKKGDITLENTQAIVNAANSSLLGGGGVDGAIHRAGGPEILSACKKIREQKGTCPPGEAVITTGGKLNANFVIHTVGPVWKGGEHNEENILKTAYFNSLKLAAENHIESLSFPAISTGIYQFPKETAAKIALETTRDFLDENHIEEIRFILYAERDFKIYENNYRNIFNLY